jgi:hypothetical protein
MKLIIYERLDSYIEEDVKKWFDDLYKAIKRFKIKHAKNIINFDKMGARVKYARSKDMIILMEVMELY